MQSRILTVTHYGQQAFLDCTGLTRAAIPSSVTEIGFAAFGNCPLLTLTVTRDGYAEQYCKAKNLPYVYADGAD